MKKIFILWAVGTALLYGCNSERRMYVAHPSVPSAFRGNKEKSDTSSLANLSWKQFFTEAALQRLVDSAIVRNLDLERAVKNIEEALLLYKQVKWNDVPQAALNVTAATNRPSDNSLTGLSLKQYGIAARHIEDYSANISLSWEADIWSKIQKQRRGAFANYLQSDEARRALQTSIVAAVAHGYYNLLMLKAQRGIAESNAALDDSTLKIIHLQFDAGQVTSLAIQQAEAESQLAAQLVSQYSENIAIQENALHVLTGAYADTVETTATLDQVFYPVPLHAGVPAQLLDQRPDVKSYALAVVAADAKAGLSRVAMYPALNITASGGVNSFLASNWFNVPASLFGIAQGSLVQPLLLHRQLLTQYRVAKVEREKAVIDFRQSVLKAVSEVSDALLKINALETQKQIATARVKTLRLATKNSRMLFEQGLANYLEVITAQANVLQGELTLATVKRDQLSAISELYRAVGGGWR